MEKIADQIDFLIAECSKSKNAFELIQSEFGERNAALVASPLLHQIKNYQSIICSLRELSKMKSN